jgi:hypothetical protein
LWSIFALFNCTYTEEHDVTLPETVQGWTRSDQPKRVTEKNIFDYMDGAGELYLGYRFQYMEAYDYTAPGLPDILVELYFMETHEDAFGLLSLDWGGDPVTPLSPAARSSIVPDARALYGAGLLRLWNARLYARIMTYEETPASRAAVLALGEMLLKRGITEKRPAFLKGIPENVGLRWILNKERVTYFRSHLVLNSIYYISGENILHLNRDTEAVLARYDAPSRDHSGGVDLLLAGYPDPESSWNALLSFLKVYLPEHEPPGPAARRESVLSIYEVEDGWMGYARTGRILALVFQCPDRNTGAAFLETVTITVKRMEDRDGGK